MNPSILSSLICGILSISNRTREYPFVCSPFDAIAKTASPSLIAEPSITLDFSTIPAMLDVRTYTPESTTSGWMDVSPPTKEHSFSLQASDTPFTNALMVSFSAFPQTMVSNTARGFAPITTMSFTK